MTNSTRMAATLDGRVDAADAVFEAKFMLPWNFSEEDAAEKHSCCRKSESIPLAYSASERLPAMPGLDREISRL
jgi:hypothetical protein